MTAKASSRRRFWAGGNRHPEQDRFFLEALDPELWEEGDAEHWDSCWYTGMPDPDVFERLAPGKTINHVPGNNALTIKSRLYRSLDAVRRRLLEQGHTGERWAERMHFFPRSYVMPEDYHLLQRDALAAPGQRWILKPSNAARGKDIRLLRDVATAPVGERWMVQEYLHHPHLMFGRKYVLRLYVLVSCVEPLRAYLYREGSAKLASEPYDPDELTNPFAYLTNPDVNARNQAAEAPVVFRTLARYRRWLREQGHDDGALFQRLEEMVALTLIAAREHMRTRTGRVRADTSGCYELLGLDCLVDADLRPWILECNLSPSLEVCAAPEDGGVEEERIKRQLVADAVALLGINDPSPPAAPADPVERILADAERELAHAGDFIRVFPRADAESFLPFFPLPRLADMVLADACAEVPPTRPRLCPWRTSELIAEDRLSLYSAATGTLYTPNPMASWIWLQAAGGADPDSLAEGLADSNAQQPLPWEVRQQVWEVLADWASTGLLRQQGPDAATADRLSREIAAPDPIGLEVLDVEYRLLPGAEPVVRRLATPLEPLLAGSGASASHRLEVLQSRTGYALALDGRLEAEALTLAEVVPAICRVLLAGAARRAEDIVLDGTLVPLAGESGAIWFAPGTTAAALPLVARLGTGLAGGLVLARSAPESGRVLGLPARLLAERADRLRDTLGPRWLGGQDAPLHSWSAEHSGPLLAAHGPCLGRSYRIAAVVLPAAPDSGPENERGLRRPGVHEALAGLLPACLGAGGQALAEESVEFLSDWLARRPVWQVDAGIAAAVESLLERLSG